MAALPQNFQRRQYINGHFGTDRITLDAIKIARRRKISTRFKKNRPKKVKKLAKKFAFAVQIVKATYNFSVVYLFKSTNSTDKD